MGKEIGLPGFLLGVLAGSVVTLLFTTQEKIMCKSDTIDPDATEGEVVADRHSTEEGQSFEGPLNDSGYHPRSANGHRRFSSISNDSSSLASRNGFIEEEETSSLSSSRSKKKSYAENPDSGTNCQVISAQDWETDDTVLRQAKDFEEQILSKLRNSQDMVMALRRTRAVNALAHTLTMAKDEKECFEVVSRLLVPLFKIDACGFLLAKNSETVIVKHATCVKQEYATKLGLEGGPDGVVLPLKAGAIAYCAETLEQHYTPRTKDSPYPNQRITHRLGLNTQLTTPIIVNRDKFAGCIIACMEPEDGFNEIDRMLVNNVAHMLGASIYSKRLRLAAEHSNKISREMLHSMIPAKVIEKIECFWDESTAEYQSRRCSSFVTSATSQGGSIDDSDRGFSLDDDEFDIDDNEMNPSKRSQTLKEQNMERAQNRRQNIRNKINLLNEMNRDGPSEHVGVVIDTSAMELSSTHRALYAETVSNVCIIFTDIVNFSQISLDMKPIKVMDMLQDLFSRFDVLCDRFGIEKLETIGDAYICTTSMFDEDDKNDINAASNALSMAKEMVKEARRVLIPKKNNSMQTLEIRVGIHIGDLTCGVLGERLPKFTVFGSSVNMAARMEQTCLPSRIRVTKDFFDLLPDTESETVEAKEVISAKNMGDVETYLLNPLLELEGESESTPLSLYDEKVLSTHWENGCSSHNSLYD